MSRDGPKNHHHYVNVGALTWIKNIVETDSQGWLQLGLVGLVGLVELVGLTQVSSQGGRGKGAIAYPGHIATVDMP